MASYKMDMLLWPSQILLYRGVVPILLSSIIVFTLHNHIGFEIRLKPRGYSMDFALFHGRSRVASKRVEQV